MDLGIHTALGLFAGLPSGPDQVGGVPAAHSLKLGFERLGEGSS